MRYLASTGATENNGTMADWKHRARNLSLGWCAIALSCLCASAAQAQPPTPVYSAKIYGRGNADSLPGSGDSSLGKNSMVVDPAGNIYVTGTTFNGLNTDFLTVKYSAAGAILWRTIANGAGNGDDFAYGIAFDINGNVLVTGSSETGGQFDYLTVKYNSSGIEQWRATLDGAANRDDAAYAIGVDGAGNVMVTGASIAYGNNYDYVTVKYSSTGVEQWRESMEGAGASIDWPVAMCVEASGNTVVTGYSLNSLNFDYVTIKYNSMGQDLWKRAMNRNTNGNDVAFAMACDASGNVYVTGRSSNGTDFDYLTVKYEGANGIEQWRAVMNGALDMTSWDDTSYAIAVDNSGNVIVTGQSDQNNTAGPSVTNPVHRTVKYNAGGMQQWRMAVNGSGTGVDVFSALATDSTGNIYTTGFSDNAGSNDLVVLKHSPGGAELWRKFVCGAGSNSGAVLMAINVDSSGNVVVAGHRNNGSDNDFLVARLDSNGDEEWCSSEGENSELPTAFASGSNGRNAVAADASGNIYVTGQSGLAANGDFITAKINGGGTVLWRELLNGATGVADRAYALAVDGSGNVYVAGESFGAGNSDYMTVKYDSAGAEQWRAQPGYSVTATNSARALALDATGNVIVSGYAASGAEILTIKYNSSGGELWRRSANGVANAVDMPVALAIDAGGNIVVTGRSSDGIVEGYLTIKYNASGVELWRAMLNGNGTEPRQAYAMAIDATGNIVVAGDSIAKYAPNGVRQWRTTDSFHAHALALGADGTVVVGGTGGLIIRYSANGTEQWYRVISGIFDENDVVHSLAVDLDGSVYALGRNETDINGYYRTVKYSSDGTERWRFTTLTAGGGATGIPALLLDTNRNVILVGHAVSGGLPSAMMVAKFSQLPPAPTGVSATPGNGAALISFSPPASDPPVTGHTVSCQPGSIATAGGAASPILVTGLANGTTYMCSVAAINAFGVGPASGAVSVTPSASAPLALFSVLSRKIHDGVGPFDVTINHTTAITGPVDVEPRSIGLGHTLLFQFNGAVTLPGSVVAQDASSSPIGNVSQVAVSGNDVTITLTGIPDNQRVRVILTGVNGSTNVEAAIGFLVGDVNKSRSVNASDIAAVKARQGQPASLANYTLDLDASGIIDAFDQSAAKARAGMLLP